MPTVFLPHGGGPWPRLPLPMFGELATKETAAYMRSLAELPPVRPSALLVVSAHWEERLPTVNTGTAPGMMYDYNGFPPEAYELQWPAPDEPALARRVAALLQSAGFETGEDDDRGYDHGVFVPLMLAYPEADIPTVQLSLVEDLDPASHLAMGRALAPLRDEGVYILGSGNSFHNMSRDRGPEMVRMSHEFDDWLSETIALDETRRDDRLVRWAEAPAAQCAHPREEHLIPLMVVAGAAGSDRGRRNWYGELGRMRVSSIVFDEHSIATASALLA